jgi:predicted esterase
MTKYGNDDLVIYGYSQGAMIAIREKRKLAEQYPAGTSVNGQVEVPAGGQEKSPLRCG